MTSIDPSLMDTVRRIEGVCRDCCQLAVVSTQSTHGFHVFGCELATITGRIPKSLEIGLREILGTDSPVYVDRNSANAAMLEIAVPREPPLDADFLKLAGAGAPAGIPFLVGPDMHDQTRWGDLSVVPHALITGASGTGKSCARNCMIKSLHLNAHDKVKIVGIDTVKPLSLEQIPSDILFDAASRPDAAVVLLAKVRRIVEKRNGKAPETEGDHLVILVEEFATLRQDVPKIVEPLKYLAKVAREARVSLVLVTQTPQDVPNHIFNELRCRLVFRLDSADASKSAVGNNRASGLRRGELVFWFGGHQTIVRVPKVPS